MTRRSTEVAYVGGWGRSGSTLLSYLLGTDPAFCPVGELRYIWAAGLRDNELCGCGTPFMECPFWTEVGEEAFGGWHRVRVDDAIRLERLAFRRAAVPLLLPARDVRPLAGRLDGYSRLLESLYPAIRAVSGCDVIVDSTKDPPYAFLLRRIMSIRLVVIHLVRDSRGVQYSWAKRVRRPEITGSSAFLPNYGAWSSGALWTIGNGMFDLLAATGTRTIRMRYEDLAATPDREYRRLLKALGRPDGAGDLLASAGLEIKPQHTLRGNPMRFATGLQRIRVDDEWVRLMPQRDRYAVTALTWPLLLRYGYPLRRS